MKYLVMNLSEDDIKKCVDGGLVGLTQHQLHARINDVDGDYGELQSHMDRLMGRGKTPEEILTLSEIGKTDRVITLNDGIIWYAVVEDGYKYEREAGNGIYHSRKATWTMATIEAEKSINSLETQMKKNSEQLFPLVIESLKEVLDALFKKVG